MFFLENKFLPTKKQEEFVDFIFSNSFPWYYQPSTTTQYMFYAHCLMKRQENLVPETGIVNSDLYLFAESILLDFCKANNIRVNTILRGSFNRVHYHPDKHSEIHVDHDFPHNNFIMYLEDCADAPTLIFDENDNIVREIKPEKYKAVVFSGERHAICHPRKENTRTVLVMTFI